MTLTCLCCGFTQAFADEDAAYRAGWDTPAHFTLQPFCPLCPSAPVVLQGLAGAQARHAPLHERWAREGRPELFDIAAEWKIDGLTPEEIADHERQIEKLKQLVADYRRRMH